MGFSLKTAGAAESLQAAREHPWPSEGSGDASFFCALTAPPNVSERENTSRLPCRVGTASEVLQKHIAPNNQSRETNRSPPWGLESPPNRSPNPWPLCPVSVLYLELVDKKENSREC